MKIKEIGGVCETGEGRKGGREEGKVSKLRPDLATN